MRQRCHHTNKKTCFILLMWMLHLTQCSGVQGWPSIPVNGNLTLEKPYTMFYVGETLTLHCHKTSNFAGVVEFQHGNVVIDKGFVTNVSDTYARMDKPVTGNDWAETIYLCRDNDGLIGSTLGPIYTDYEPTNATDLQIVWLNKQRIKIAWQFGNITFKNSHSDKVIRFFAQWSTNPNDDTAWHNCSEATSTTCTDNFTNEHAHVSVRVSVSNLKRNDTVITLFPPVRVLEHAKPNPVDSVVVTDISSTAVSVTVTSMWTFLNYNITYCTTVNHNPHCHTLVTNLTQDKQFEVSGLRPFHNYTFKVRASYREGYLSELPSEGPQHFQMPQDAPSSGPVVCQGCYYMDHSACPDLSTAYIYYQEVTEEDQNGIIRNYSVKVRTEGEYREFSQAAQVMTLKVSDVPCLEGFGAFVYASTDVGHSPLTSLSVPAWNQVFHAEVEKLDLKIKSTNDGVVTAEWCRNPSLANHSLLLFFCNRDGKDNKQCLTAIHSIEVDMESERQPLMSANGNMRFGVAAVSEEGMTTGIVVTECIYDPDRVAGSPPDNVQAIAQNDHILVSWRGLQRCDTDRRVIVLSYELQVCLPPQTADCPLHNIDVQSNSFRLTGVELDTVYMVSVRAQTTSYSAWTPFSAAASAVLPSPPSKELKAGEIAGIAIGVLSFVIFVGCCIFWQCRKRVKSLGQRFVGDIDIPEPPVAETNDRPLPALPNGEDDDDDDNSNNNNNNNSTPRRPHTTEHQDSNDSGYDGNNDSLSPPLSPAPNTQDSTQELLDDGIAKNVTSSTIAFDTDGNAFNTEAMPTTGVPNTGRAGTALSVDASGDVQPEWGSSNISLSRQRVSQFQLETAGDLSASSVGGQDGGQGVSADNPEMSVKPYVALAALSDHDADYSHTSSRDVTVNDNSLPCVSLTDGKQVESGHQHRPQTRTGTALSVDASGQLAASDVQPEWGSSNFSLSRQQLSQSQMENAGEPAGDLSASSVGGQDGRPGVNGDTPEMSVKPYVALTALSDHDAGHSYTLSRDATMTDNSLPCVNLTDRKQVESGHESPQAEGTFHLGRADSTAQTSVASPCLPHPAPAADESQTGSHVAGFYVQSVMPEKRQAHGHVPVTDVQAVPDGQTHDEDISGCMSQTDQSTRVGIYDCVPEATVFHSPVSEADLVPGYVRATATHENHTQEENISGSVSQNAVIENQVTRENVSGFVPRTDSPASEVDLVPVYVRATAGHEDQTLEENFSGYVPQNAVQEDERTDDSVSVC